MIPFMTQVDAKVLRKEKERAREIRESAWWKNQVGKGFCFYCQARIAPSELTMDHKTPVVRGGRSNRQNLVPCCKACNSEKKYMCMEEFLQYRQDQGRPLACDGATLR